MMPDHTNIYEREAAKYHELIAKQPDLRECMEELRPLNGLDIVDMGAGTGRLSMELAPQAKSIIALDASEAMLRITADKLTAMGLTNWTIAVADHRKLPLPDHSADLIVSGWSICYLCSTDVQDWEQNLQDVIEECKRVLRVNGTIIIFETLGTGYESPDAPDFLRGYYFALIERYGFTHQWIRTDYTFDSVQQAEELTRFFFGDELANRVVREELVRLPECAGVWWLQL